ncbi:hypothetical protein [Pseudoalteromonas tunicata]|uniref:hypothetical protein n=1 Tax=Pseudoalteromonas tunicata TaxID=314281 RepID=UPI00273E734B|nr:hypothetical protein [Pseudoalteromonas tunicata]MDP4982516.1 hypothetical protein [Pseudoalteromonas tunicata]
MKPFGGELAAEYPTIRLLDSGRSSLRLILKNSKPGQTILLPEYLCPIISEICQQYQLIIRYYPIGDDFSIDFSALDFTECDWFYWIHYFGFFPTDLPISQLSQVAVIHDCVFSPFVPPQLQQSTIWYAFTSVRKIMPVAEGSLLLSNQMLSTIPAAVNQFAAIKWQGLEQKAAYRNMSTLNEEIELGYVNKLAQGEQALTAQQAICNMTDYGLERYHAAMALQFSTLSARLAHFQLVNNVFNQYQSQPDFACFYPLKIKNNPAELLKKLRADNFFLPYFWPNREKNSIYYNKFIFIPLAISYSEEDLMRLCEKITLYDN